MAIIGYARCSSIEQSFDLQVDRLREAGAAQVFSEKRSAANTKGRHELEAALSSLRPGDTLLVTKLDRAARNVLDLLKIIERIKAAGADFRCLDQPIATDGPLGSLMLTVLGAFAQFENDIRKERQLEGIAAAKARGAFDASRFPIAPGVLSHCSRMLSQGLSYVQVSERTGVSVDTLQRRWPKYKTLTPEARSRAQKRRRAGRSREPKTPVGTILRAQAEAEAAAGFAPPYPAFSVQHASDEPKELPWAYTANSDGTCTISPVPARQEPQPKRRGLFGFSRSR